MAKHLRLTFALAIIVAVSTVMVLGCTQQPPAPTATARPATAITAASPAAASPTAAAKTVASIDRITIGISQEPDTLLQNGGSMYAASVVKDALGTETQNFGTASLVWRNDKNESIPGIAESVPTLDNGGAQFVGDGADKHLEVTYKLRKDIKWQDGTPVTSKDVKYEWQVSMDPDFPISDRSRAEKIQAVDTPDDYTVVFKFMSQNQAQEAARTGGQLNSPKEYAVYRNQNGPVVDPLYMRYGAVMPSAAYSKVAAKDLIKSDFARKPIGMGAYTLKEWVPGQSITLEANPNYFLGAPKIKTVIFRIVPDTNAIIAQLQTGDLDVVTEDALLLNNVPDFDRIGQAGTIKFIYTPAMSWEHMDLNSDNAFLKDVNVRKAIGYAIDRQSMVDKVLYGKTKVAHSWIPPISWAYSDNITKYDFDAQKAKDLLKNAGFTAGADGMLSKDGSPLRLKLQTTAGNQMRLLTTQIIQQNLKAVGVAVELDYLASKDFFATAGQGPLSSGTYDMAVYATIAGDDPTDGAEAYQSNNIPTRDNGYQGDNFARWSNQENDDLLNKAGSSIDPNARKPLYAQELQIFADQLPTLPLFQRLNIAAAKARLQNFKPTSTNTPPTWNIYEWVLPAQ